MTKALDEEQPKIEEFQENDIDVDDYGFVIGPDGELKTLFMPEDVPFVPPKNITKILKLLGINDIDNIGGSSTIH
jgi:hypothetical protein